MKKRIITTALTVVLVAACSIGATLAYLTATTEKVENTFVAGEIGTLTLTEDKTDSTVTNTGEYIIVPGETIIKNPSVTFDYDETNKEGVNRPAYVFVTVKDESWTYDDVNKKFTSIALTGTVDNTEKDNVEAGAMGWMVDSDWTYLLTDTNEGYVFYKTVNPAGDFTSSIINENEIAVNATLVTEENIGTLAEAVSGLAFKAYAIQQEAIKDAETAWSLVKPAQQTN